MTTTPLHHAPLFHVTNAREARTVRLRMSGRWDADALERVLPQLRAAVHTYGEARHLLHADLRGAELADVHTTRLLASALAHARRRGLVRCALVGAPPLPGCADDGVTVAVPSEAVAEAVLARARTELISRFLEADTA